MATGNFPVPPTFAPPFTEDPVTKQQSINPLWLSWFIECAAFFSAAGGSGGAIAHNNTAGLQGGSANQYYHLTASQQANLTAAQPVFTNIAFGTFTLGALAQTGSILIKDAGGTNRRLLVG